MRILQVITRNELRGAESFAALLSRELMGRGHDILIVALYRQRDGQQAALPFPADRIMELHGKRQGRLEWMPWFRMLQTCRKYRPEVVQANGFHALKYAVLTRLSLGASWPIVYRNISVAGRWTRGRLKRWWGRWLFSKVAAVASVSHGAAQDLVTTYGLSPQQVQVIHRGIPLPDVDPRTRNTWRMRLREALAISSTAKVVMHIAGFTPEKNHRDMIDAFHWVVRRVSDAHLLCVGDGPLWEEIRRYAQERGLQLQVTFWPARVDVTDYLTGADVAALSSNIEGVPGVVLEAAARAVPSVCTNVGSTAEAVIDGVTGYLVPPGDVAALADALVRVLMDAERAEQMGLAARRHAHAQFDIDATVDRFERLYRRVLEQQPRANAAVAGDLADGDNG